ncbi:hypothetical protein F4775DRAFT_600732 [Biscogniauxia sp. FL1348]|nr:hypothetical protein F4775DRAFT_600732 [Biscogniauxia sp. FL1348]
MACRQILLPGGYEDSESPLAFATLSSGNMSVAAQQGSRKRKRSATVDSKIQLKLTWGAKLVKGQDEAPHVQAPQVHDPQVHVPQVQASKVEAPQLRQQGNKSSKGSKKPSPLDMHVNKPQPYGKPPVCADKRAAMSNALPYFRQHQSSISSIDLCAQSMFIDGLVGKRDKFLSQVIITTVGGGRVLDPTNKQMTRTKDQDTNSVNYRALMNAHQNKTPVVMIAGAGNPLFPVKPEHYLNVLDYFHVTDVWSEATVSEGGKVVRHFMVRFEKMDLQTRSWWSPANGPEPDRHDVGDYQCHKETCSFCNRESKEIYIQGWTCLQRACKKFMAFNTPINVDDLEYNENFLGERTLYRGSGPRFPLVPALPSAFLIEDGAKYGVEREYKEGIVCPQCSLASRRLDWNGWYCERPGCDFTYATPMRDVPLHLIKAETYLLLGKKKEKFFLRHDAIKTTQAGLDGYEINSFFLPGDSGNVVGSVLVFKALDATCRRPGGIDDLYNDMQKSSRAGEINLRRNPARVAGHHMEEVTSHFSSNIGAHYKFGVVVKTSCGFDEAPKPALEALSRLTWAGKMATDKSIAYSKKHQFDISEESMPAQFTDFNEELILGYFEDSKISYHDDGEKELGPTVATLSLGSPAVMYFRPKKRTTIGEASKSKKGDRPPMLGFVLEHGDMVIMHGRDIHKYYEHMVQPEGTLRFAMTCRYIRPETILDESRRKESIEKGQVPAEWKEKPYDGEHDTGNNLGNVRAMSPGFISQISTGDKVAAMETCLTAQKEAAGGFLCLKKHWILAFHSRQ